MNVVVLVILVLILVLVCGGGHTDNGGAPTLARKYSTHIVPHASLLGDEAHPLAHLFPTTAVPRIQLQLYPTSIKVDDQGQYGSCTAHAARYAWELMMYRAQLASGSAVYTPTLSGGPSRAFLYGEARLQDARTAYGTLSAARIKSVLQTDSGATISAVVWVLQNRGQLAESGYPYTRTNILGGAEANIALAVPYKFPAYPLLRGVRQTAPKKIVFGGSPASQAATLAVMQSALSTKHAIVLGICVYQSFESATALSTGSIPMPGGARDRLLGGHAICLSGYDTGTSRFSFANSWGVSYGIRGMFTIPFAYITNWNYAFDAWII